MKRDYMAILLEDMNHKFDIIMEAIQPLPTLLRDMAVLKTDVDDIKADIKIIKAAVTDHSKILLRHDREIARLNGAVFKA